MNREFLARALLQVDSLGEVTLASQYDTTSVDVAEDGMRSLLYWDTAFRGTRTAAQEACLWTPCSCTPIGVLNSEYHPEMIALHMKPLCLQNSNGFRKMRPGSATLLLKRDIVEAVGPGPASMPI